MPGSVGWRWSPAVPCSDMVVVVAALTLDPGLALVQSEVEGVGNPEPNAEGFHNESTSSPSGILYHSEPVFHTRCRLGRVLGC